MNTGTGGQFRWSQSGWFGVVEVKAVAKRGVKTFPVYLRLFLSAVVAGGLTASHRRGKVVSHGGRERPGCLFQATNAQRFVFSGVKSFKPSVSSKSR